MLTPVKDGALQNLESFQYDFNTKISSQTFNESF